MDDSSPLLAGDHGSGNLLRAMPRADEINLDCLTESRVVHLHRFDEWADAGVVDQHVNMSEPGEGRRHHGVNRRAIRHVAGQADGIGGAFGDEVASGLHRQRLVHVGDHDLRLLPGKASPDAKPNALSATEMITTWGVLFSKGFLAKVMAGIVAIGHCIAKAGRKFEILYKQK